jgi:hypothetical protein
VAGLLKLSGLAEAPIALRHVPVDAGHGNRLGAHHGVVDNVIDDVRARRADVLMHQEIAGAVVVKIADATNADVRASLGDSGAGYNCIVLYGEHLECSHPVRTILMHQDIGGAVVVEVARAVEVKFSGDREVQLRSSGAKFRGEKAP